MGSIKISFIKKFLTIGLVGILTASTCAIGAYFLVKTLNDSSTVSVRASNIENKQLLDFYKKNSLKITLKTGETEKENILSLGTAWSWYYHYENNQFVWYLMTNFHVTNSAAHYAFSLNNPNPQSHSMNYINRLEIPFNTLWSLDEYDNPNPAFHSNPIISPYVDFFVHNEFTNSKNDNNFKMSLIIDNKQSPAVNSGIDLFSKYNKNGNLMYNLDMSLLKITFPLENYYKQFQTSFEKIGIANPYQNYLNNKGNYKGHVDLNNMFTVIAGNPADENTLIGQFVDNQLNNWWLQANFEPLKKKDDSEFLNENIFLKSLKGDYYYTSKFINQWLLTPGASGSAVYQIDNLQTITTNKIKETIPIGIYWGGAEKADRRKLFAPSFIPLICDKYNIFENFTNYLQYKSGYNY